MSRNCARLVLCLTSSIFSLQALAAVPFSDQELATMRQYMYANIASKEKVFSKNDEVGQIITSMPGAVLASPSNKGYGFSQDYQFHWMRDAGITMRQVFKDYEWTVAQHQDISLLNIKLKNYIDFERNAQQQFSNPGEETLGQPKFNIDGTVWEGAWARPQNDGPALRALALCEMGRESATIMRQVVPMIKTDLDYVVKEWRQPNFDLWEEVKDSDHFFTKMMQQRALTCAGNLLYFSDHPVSQLYTNTSKDITQSLEKHWNEKLGYITESVNELNNKGGGLNSAVVLAVLYGNELGEARYQLDWSVRDDRVMATVAALRNTFAYEYPINHGNPHATPLIGRYPNDKYDGNHFEQGNPWVLTTVAMAEYYYSLAYVYRSMHLPIHITQRNLGFFTQLSLSNITQDTIVEYGTIEYNNIINALIAEGDRYLQVIKRFQHCEPSGSCMHFAEQIDAKSGDQTSAKDLTWGYVSILRAMDVRKMLNT